MSDEVTSLKEEYQSAKTRFQEQRETFKEFSKEGLKVFRLSVLLVGVPAAVFGAINPQSLTSMLDSLYSAECAVQSFSFCLTDMRFMTNLVIPSFLLAVLLHIMASGFEARGIQNETNPHDIHEVRNATFGDEEFYRAKLLAYEGRIEDNDRVISVIESLLGTGKFLFGTAVTGVVAIAYSIILNRPFEGLWLLFALIILFISTKPFPHLYIRADGGLPWTFTPPYPPNEQRGSALERLDDD